MDPKEDAHVLDKMLLEVDPVFLFLPNDDAVVLMGDKMLSH